jgi:cellulose 1,4-beta-cellobiosidase
LHRVSRLILSPIHVIFCVYLSIEIEILREIARNGVQPTSQLAWGDWRNVIGTGFGVRPTTNTGDPLGDAFVWVKPGGECDGTSSTTSADMISTVAWLMLSNPLQKLAHGSRYFPLYYFAVVLFSQLSRPILLGY